MSNFSNSNVNNKLMDNNGLERKNFTKLNLTNELIDKCNNNNNNNGEDDTSVFTHQAYRANNDFHESSPPTTLISSIISYQLKLSVGKNLCCNTGIKFTKYAFG